ncbi:hypothetical protein FOA52_014401 [Chlamydomonas sp. UWO 241]|nr:hypothetical protein FOA52_014401 [Chlamydomonas sp. UWO 241]
MHAWRWPRSQGSFYLAAYNLGLLAGWAYVLGLTIKVAFVEGGSPADVYAAVALPLMVSQTAAVMEIVHSAIGVVRSPLFVTATQVFSRLWILWGIVVPVSGPVLSGSVGFPGIPPLACFSFTSLMVAWATTEVIRYSFFGLKELGSVPYISLWLRYSAFIPLYPIGVASELTMVWLAMPTIGATRMWSVDMPNAFNDAFDYYIACVVVVALYLPGLPYLYAYMLTQRGKMLSPTKATKPKAQ